MHKSIAHLLLTINLLLFAISSHYAQPVLQFTPVVSGLPSPLDIVPSPIGTNSLYIVQRGATNGTATILTVQNNSLLNEPFLSISGISCCGERGLLSMVFHPQFTTNRTFFIFFTAGTTGALTIERWQTTGVSEPLAADPATRQVMLSIPHPRTNHNGGKLLFGADGYLYIGTGDGGGSNDPDANAQNPQSLLGKMLRINPDVAATTAPFYTIPADNPYANPNDGIRDEIFAMGLRNPWRWSFDAATGHAWIADVGQSAREELNHVTPAQLKGANFGWRCFEATLTNNATGIQPCSLYNNQPHLQPVYAYDRSSTTGGRSVTGGFVYRGSAYPQLQGYYIMADYVTPAAWLLKTDGSYEAIRQGTGIPSNITSFGVSAQQELYAVSITAGILYQVQVAATLPLRILSFKGTTTTLGHQLEWQVAEAEPGTMFTLQKAMPDGSFTVAAQPVPARPGKTQYTLQLPVPYQLSKVLYRLKATLPNGDEIFSKQLWLSAESSLHAWLTPNALRINGGSNILAVRVTDVQGRLIQQVQGRQQPGTLTLWLPASAGRLFMVHITQWGGSSTTLKLFR
ncbi:MAG: PQQ-dependent sugar dehydrogenase [Chitinophagaceae bacterium]|jgi:glucose/arabinose dehydrogenase|nr:PQQ-dependent sugar dehydrogenase [Chitinophagaceae bacterium]